MTASKGTGLGGFRGIAASMGLDGDNARSRAFISNYAIYLVFIVLIVAGALTSPQFLTWDNLRNTMQAVAFTGFAALGMLFVTTAGGFVDLSIPATIAASGIIALGLQSSLGPIGGLVAGIALGGITARHAMTRCTRSSPRTVKSKWQRSTPRSSPKPWSLGWSNGMSSCGRPYGIPDPGSGPDSDVRPGPAGSRPWVCTRSNGRTGSSLGLWDKWSTVVAWRPPTQHDRRAMTPTMNPTMDWTRRRCSRTGPFGY